MAPEEQIQMQQKISFPVRKCATCQNMPFWGAYDTHCGFLALEDEETM